MKTEVKPDVEIDTKGLQCPRPLLKAKQTLERMNAGEILKVVSNDPTTKTTFAAYLRRSGDELLSITDEGGVIQFLIRKAGGQG